MKDKIVLLNRFDSRKPSERTMIAVLDAANFCTSNRLLGGGSACSKDSAHTVESPSLKSYHQSHSKDPAVTNPLQNQY